MFASQKQTPETFALRNTWHYDYFNSFYNPKYMYFGLRWQFCPYSFKSVGRGHWLLAGWLAAALPRLGQCLQQPGSSRLGLGRLSRLDRHRRSMASWEGKAGGAAWPVTWNLLIFWRFPLNIKLTNEINKSGNKFYTRDMLLKSRSGQNELKNNMKNNMKNKSKGDTKFNPKFTPRRSYISIEVLTKSRFAL